MKEIKDLIGKIFRNNEERRAWYGSCLAEMEERLQQAEDDALTAYEGFAERGTLKGSGMGRILEGQQQLRGEVNAMWAEMEKPTPDWSMFNARA